MRHLLRIVGVLALVLLWTALVLPVRVLDDDRFGSEPTFILGVLPLSLSAVGYVLACVVATALVVHGFVRGHGPKAAATLVLLGVVAAFLSTRPGADDLIMWDGRTASGEYVGGAIATQLAAGAWCAVVGGALLVLLGLVHLARSSARPAGAADG